MDQRERNIILAIAISASHHLLDTFIFSTESQHQVEGVINLQMYYLNQIMVNLRGRRQKPVRIEGYLLRSIPNMNSSQFRQHFRMKPEVFENLENILGPKLAKANNVGRSMIPVRTQLLMTLWLLATPDSYRSVGDRFDAGKSSASDSFVRVIKSLCGISGGFIRWPNAEETREIKRKFFSWARQPDVMGAIDGTDVEIKAAKIESQAYINRKRKYGVILQAVCQPNLKFLDCFAGYPGSVGDLRVLKNSPLYLKAMRDTAAMFPDNGYIIGDKIYPTLSWLITAYRDHGALTQVQKNFNKALARTRQVIERAFALLKGRIRRLKYLDMNRIDMVSYVILACCVLHNICLDGVRDDIEEFVEEGRQNINLRGNNEERDAIRAAPQEEVGQAKRNYLAAIVPIVD